MKITTKVFLGFAIILIFSIAGFLIQFKLSQEVNRNMGFVSHSEEIIRTSTSIHKSIIEMQGSVRGYLLTENEIFLEPYYNGLQIIPVLIKGQRELVKSTPHQLHKLDSIQAFHDKWILYSENLLSSKKESKISETGKVKYGEAFNKRLMKGEGIKQIAAIKKLFVDFDKIEYENRNSRRKALKVSIQFANYSSIGIIFLDLFIALTIGYVILNTVSKRISDMVSWAEEISKGRFIIREDAKNDELRRLSDSLNTMSKQLNYSFAELQEKNKELDQYAYATSHDLKAPLRGMYNILTWIEEDIGDEVPEQLKVYHNKLKGRISRLEKLINGLLEYARISRQERIPEIVNIPELLASLTDLIIPPGFKVRIHNSLNTILIEKILLEQVLTNLISNAVKFQNKPGLESITINCFEQEKFYCFSVKDNGVGISTEYYDKIFALFQTLREKHENEDTGIGLSIVKKIIDEKNGTISVESVPGKGSTFTIRWPKLK